tara:strand:+ start:1987 stop:2919 length:933 start_codon:yes stop_codon:yes gene_type:complete
MNELEPISQKKLFGLDAHFLELIRLHKSNKYPNKILLSGLKGLGKSTLAYHFINYVLSENENQKYDLKNFQINIESQTFKTILNKSNTNFIKIDIDSDKKNIDIKQIRDLITSLNKSCFNSKPRFVLIDNIELLNINSINALLKVLEEPNENVNFILINNNKRVLSTLLSRCINFRINLSNKECLNIINNLLDNRLENFINLDLINYYLTPGNIYYLAKFAERNNYDLSKINLKNFLKIIIKENFYKKDFLTKYIIFELIELYFRKLNTSFSEKNYDKYTYFIKRIFDTKKFNLDEDSLFIEFEREILSE